MFKFIIRSALAIGSLVFLIIFGVRSCASYEYPRPSEAFYVSDFADMLGPTLENFLISESEYLYEEYKDVPEVGGMQIVQTTFLLENDGELANYNKDHLFNEWKIGKNGMGILIIYYFVPHDGAESEYDLTEIQIATGNKFGEYVGTIGLLNMVRDTIDVHFPSGSVAIPYDYDLAMGIASLTNEILNVAYGDIYGAPENVIPRAEFEIQYEEYFDNYTGTTSFNTSSSMNLFLYFFSGFGSSLDKILFASFAFTFALASGVAIKGGGGSSFGLGLFRHRN